MHETLLSKINSPKDLKDLKVDQLVLLAEELRQFIINVVSVKEGHLGASLGVVELTLALHYIFDAPKDKLIWDVGHQAYGHKILTGRRAPFDTNRQLGGLSGFPKRSESVYDAFGTGHSSTSISAALGMAVASQLKGDKKINHIAVIGDASIASGMAFEGLNHAGVTDANLLVVLNDNEIGIDPSVGALKRYLRNVKTGNQKSPNLFEALNFKYFGPVDGHDIEKLLEILKTLKKIKGPKALHVITTKGKGLKQAEIDQVRYHAPGKFDALTGEIPKQKEQLQPPKFQDVFGLTLVELAEKNEHIVGITPAMPTGSSLKYMMERFPTRAFDVGIAEQHAVTFAAGLAASGMQVFCNIYSTFLQRAYDQVIHDVALQNIPVIFCLDRAGLVGEDGPTHHGVYDIAFLRAVPNLIIYAPKDEMGLRDIMYTASLGLEYPIAIRYPRGRGREAHWQKPFKKISIGKAEIIQEGEHIAILSTGTIWHNAVEAIALANANCSHYHFGFIKPLDQNLLQTIFKKYHTIITVEDATVKGGFGSAIAEIAFELNYKGRLKILGIPDAFIEHGSVTQLQDSCGISATKIASVIKRFTLQ